MEMKSVQKEIYDIHDLATILGRPERGIRIALSRGSKTVPPSFKLGGRRVWLKKEVTKWIADLAEKHSA